MIALGVWTFLSTALSFHATKMSHLRKLVCRPRDRGVTLLSSGLDELPACYRSIETVMAAETDLVEVLARFDPKLVKMCPSSERPVD